MDATRNYSVIEKKNENISNYLIKPASLGVKKIVFKRHTSDSNAFLWKIPEHSKTFWNLLEHSIINLKKN